jgi:hypothetical protein
MSFGTRWVAPILPDFFRRYPDIAVDLHLSDEKVDLSAASVAALTGVGLPDSLTRSFSLMGQVAGGAGLFLTGLLRLWRGSSLSLRSRRARRLCCQLYLSGSSASCSDCASISRPRLQERR